MLEFGCDHIVFNSFQKSDVKRIWSLHETLLSFSVSSNENSVKDLLLRATQSHTFLTSNDGVRLIIFLFSLNPAFVEELHAAIKEKIAESSDNKQVQELSSFSKHNHQNTNPIGDYRIRRDLSQSLAPECWRFQG